MVKKNKQSRDELAFPIATVPHVGRSLEVVENQALIKQIIRGAIQCAYQLKTPSEPHCYSSEYGKKQKPLVTNEQVQLITSLIESLCPSNVIECALAAQFAIAHIRGLYAGLNSNINTTIEVFRFSHDVLEAFQRFRTKGAQSINVNYNHNSGQIFNIKSAENTSAQAIEV